MDFVEDDLLHLRLDKADREFLCCILSFALVAGFFMDSIDEKKDINWLNVLKES